MDPCGKAEGVNVLAVSVFDHWLTEEEADHQLGEVTKEKQIERNRRHFSFLKRLVSETEVLSFRIAGRRKTKIIFSKFVNIDQCLRHLAPILTASSVQDRISAALPELHALYIEGYDDTYYLYYREEQLIANFKSWVTDAGLFVL